MDIKIDSSVKRLIPNCRLGVLAIRGITVRGTPPALAEELALLQAKVAATYRLDALTSGPNMDKFKPIRRKTDWDAGQCRPAPEPLVRRLLQNKGNAYVNTAVDVVSYCSLKYLLPFGLYDLDRISGDVLYKLFPENCISQEEFGFGIADNSCSADMDKEIPYLTDAAGPFGTPAVDSTRTAVTLTTRNVLIVLYADTEYADEQLEEMLGFAGQMFVRYNRGSIAEKKIVAGCNEK